MNERFPREATSIKTREFQTQLLIIKAIIIIEIWWSRLVDGKEPVCLFAGTFVMIVGALVTWAIYTQGQLLL